METSVPLLTSRSYPLSVDSAHVCLSPLRKLVSFFYLAWCRTGTRFRRCQSGVKEPWVVDRRLHSLRVFSLLWAKKRADERTRTALLLIRSGSVRGCRGLLGLANTAFLKGFLFSDLPSVAPYCVPGGIRVVSMEA